MYDPTTNDGMRSSSPENTAIISAIILTYANAVSISTSDKMSPSSSMRSRSTYNSAPPPSDLVSTASPRASNTKDHHLNPACSRFSANSWMALSADLPFSPNNLPFTSSSTTTSTELNVFSASTGASITRNRNFVSALRSGFSTGRNAVSVDACAPKLCCRSHRRLPRSNLPAFACPVTTASAVLITWRLVPTNTSTVFDTTSFAEQTKSWNP